MKTDDVWWLKQGGELPDGTSFASRAAVYLPKSIVGESDMTKVVGHVRVAGILALVFVVLSPVFAQERVAYWNLDPKQERALNAATDILGQEVLAQGEPSFDGLAKYFPPMRRPRVVVGVKEHPEEIGVTWDGVLELARPFKKYWGAARLSFRLGDPPSPYGLEGPVTHSLLKGYLPAVETRWQYQGLLYEELVFGHSRGLSADEKLFAYVRLRVKNPGESDRRAVITVFCDPALGDSPVFEATAPSRGQHDFYFKIPHALDPHHLVLPIESAEFNQALRETDEFWTRLLNSGMKIQVPEAGLNDAYRAWLMYSFLDVDKVNGIYEPHDGSGFYEEIYGYSSGVYCNALSLLGYWGETEKYLASLLHFQREDGLFTMNYGPPDNGALLFAIGRQYRMGGNLNWFKSVAPMVRKSCEWIVRNREKSKASTDGAKSITYGLLPPAQSYCDFGEPVISYHTDTYNWMGLHEVGLAFQKAGLTAEGGKWLKEADDYRKDILSSMDRSVVEVGGLKVLPVEPETRRLVKQGAGDYYALIAPMLLETEIFDARDEKVLWVSKFMEERGGLLLGLSRIGEGVDHAYTYGYALSALRRDEIDKFLLTFYGYLAYGMSHETYSGVEVNELANGLNEHTLPHLLSSAQQLRMLRMMLVREEGDALLLAWATPRAWLEDGKTIAVRDAPTLAGSVTYLLTSMAAHREIRAIVEPFAKDSPSHVKLRLRAPKTLGSIKEVMVNGKPWRAFDEDTIQLEGSTLQERLEIVAKY